MGLRSMPAWMISEADSRDLFPLKAFPLVGVGVERDRRERKDET